MHGQFFSDTNDWGRLKFFQAPPLFFRLMDFDISDFKRYKNNAKNKYMDGEKKMTVWLLPLLIIVVWLALQLWILPRFGVST